MPLKPSLQAATLATKRGRSTDLPSPSPRSASPPPPPLTSTSSLPRSRLAALPAFLRQSHADLSFKFELLARKQRARLLEGRESEDPEHEWAQEGADEIRLRNRWDDIRPWKRHRVHLKVPSDRLDYINASPILLKCAHTGVERRYIATQGPKDNGFGHFWQMAWHETGDVAVIVMLTRFEENFRPKCARYFPEHKEDGSIEIETTDETGAEYKGSVTLVSSTYHEATKSFVRELRLTCGEKSKTVWHLLFLGWPDNGVPESQDQEAMIQLVKLSRAKNAGWGHPRIIHCSAGVGRSGTFIALDHLVEAAERGLLDHVADNEDPVFDTVDMLRRQRMTMVQSEIQFRLLYDLVRHAFLRHLPISPSATPVNNVELAAERTSFDDAAYDYDYDGEPSPKARRVARGYKSAFPSQSQSQSQKATAEEEEKEKELNEASSSSTDQGKIP